MNDKDSERYDKELYRIVWTQAYDMTSLNELVDEIALEQSDFKEANEVINRIKNLK